MLEKPCFKNFQSSKTTCVWSDTQWSGLRITWHQVQNVIGGKNIRRMGNRKEAWISIFVSMKTLLVELIILLHKEGWELLIRWSWKLIMDYIMHSLVWAIGRLSGLWIVIEEPCPDTIRPACKWDSLFGGCKRKATRKICEALGRIDLHCSLFGFRISIYCPLSSLETHQRSQNFFHWRGVKYEKVDIQRSQRGLNIRFGWTMGPY